MDMGIVNAGALAIYDELDPELRELVEDVVLNRRGTPPTTAAAGGKVQGRERQPVARRTWPGARSR